MRKRKLSLEGWKPWSNSWKEKTLPWKKTMPRKNSLICTPFLYLEHCICVYCVCPISHGTVSDIGFKWRLFFYHLGLQNIRFFGSWVIFPWSTRSLLSVFLADLDFSGLPSEWIAVFEPRRLENQYSGIDRAVSVSVGTVFCVGRVHNWTFSELCVSKYVRNSALG